MSIRISAVVCTYNRSGYLRKAIQSLIDQTLPKRQYEILVLDNGSWDETKAVVGGFQDFGNLRYIYEPVLGLSQARNTGWRSARGEYVAYLDDDAIACPEWLERIVSAFDTVHPTPGSVGGKVVPIWEAERPYWLSRQLELALTIVDWGDGPRFLTQSSQILVGANIAYPREILEACGGFSTSLGLKGSRQSLGEELLMRNYLRCQNLGSYYDPQIRVQHHVLSERLAKRWFYRRFFYAGISDVILRHIETSQKKANWHHLWEVLLNVLHAIRHPTVLAPIILPANSAPRVVRKCHSYLLLGRIWAQLRIGFGQVGSESNNLDQPQKGEVR